MLASQSFVEGDSTNLYIDILLSLVIHLAS